MIRYRLILIISVGLLLPAFTAANELANADLEQTDADRLAAWAPYGRGYMLETGEVHSGRHAIRCEATGDQDGMGISQIIRYERPDKRPIIVGGWSKAENVGGGGDYGLFLDVIYEDGTPWWGKTANWTRGSHDWQYTAEVYRPEKPVREIRAYEIGRAHV